MGTKKGQETFPREERFPILRTSVLLPGQQLDHWVVLIFQERPPGTNEQPIPGLRHPPEDPLGAGIEYVGVEELTAAHTSNLDSQASEIPGGE